MKKMYMKPAMQAYEALVAAILAESLAINNSVTVDGSNALTKTNEWADIWTNEEE